MNKIYTFLGNIQGLSVKKDADNPFFKSKYMTLDGIMKVVNPLLKDAGLILCHYGDGENLVTAIVDLESGDKLESKLKITLTDPQKIGGCVTYFRRYNTCALLNILSDEDDDGNKASGNVDWDREHMEKKAQESKEILDEALGVCNKCGAPNKISQKGKKYCSAKCWL